MTFRGLFLPLFGVLELRRWLWWAIVRRIVGPKRGGFVYGYARLTAYVARRELVRLLKEWT